MFTARILATGISGSKPPLLADTLPVLPHVVFVVERVNGPEETRTLFDGLCNSCTQLNTFKLSCMLNYCKTYPQHVKAIIDCKDGKYSPLPLAGAAGDSAVIGALSTNRPVLVVLYSIHAQRWDT